MHENYRSNINTHALYSYFSSSLHSLFSSTQWYRVDKSKEDAMHTGLQVVTTFIFLQSDLWNTECISKKGVGGLQASESLLNFIENAAPLAREQTKPYLSRAWKTNGYTKRLCVCPSLKGMIERARLWNHVFELNPLAQPHKLCQPMPVTQTSRPIQRRIVISSLWCDFMNLKNIGIDYSTVPIQTQ